MLHLLHEAISAPAGEPELLAKIRAQGIDPKKDFVSERFFGSYRRRLRSADDIGTARATGLSPNDARELRALYEH